MRKILVIYTYMSKKEYGWGSIDFTCDYDVPTIENIREMEQQIREKFNYNSVAILNIIKLKNEDKI